MKKIYFLLCCLHSFAAFSQNFVGIGTTSPQAPLHLSASGSEMLRIQGNDAYISFYNTAGTYRGYLWDNGEAMEFGSAFNSNLPVYISSNFSIKAAFLPNGNVGIGTVNPTERLDVAGNIRSITSVTAPAHNFPAPKTYSYAISEADVIKRNELLTIDREMPGGGICILGGVGKLTAPVHLPQGASVSRLTVYYYDVSSPYNMQVTLRTSNTAQVIASVNSTGFAGEGSATDGSIFLPVINNNNYAYVLDIGTVSGPWPDVSLIFRRAVIEYTVVSL